MSKYRKKDPSLATILVRVPWWISTGLALGVYIISSIIVPSIQTDNIALQIIFPNMTHFGSVLAALFFMLSLFAFVLQKLKSKNNQTKNEIQKDQQIERKQLLSPRDVDESINLALLNKIDWKNFENICCTYFIERGLTAKTTKIGADGGVDINVYESDNKTASIVVQCKVRSKRNISVQLIREFYGVMTAKQTNHGMFITTSDFTDDAKKFVQDLPHESRLDLITGQALLKLLNALPTKAQSRILKVATQGDYTTPTCSSCGIKMIHKTIKKGKNIGNNFWGCLNYPRCKHTMTIKAGSQL